MFRTLLVAALTLAVVTLFAPVFAQSGVVYVKSSPSADLRASTDASSKIVAQLPRGKKLTVKQKKGKWYEVTADGKTGWVYEFKVSTKAPSSGDTLASLGGGGASAREGSTAASIRGLSPTSEKYAGRAKISPAHIEMVKQMESLKISRAEVEAFCKGGALGEYGATQ